MNRALTAVVLTFTLVLPSCGVAYMRKPMAGETLLTAAPAGKALVNFHRPSGFGGGANYQVFDRERLIGNSKGGMLFQYVCDPGEHVFIGAAQKGSAIRAELTSDNVYDIVINIGIGWVRANITMEPITKNHPKRGALAEWEADERLWIYADDDRCRKLEDRRRGWAQETLRDFLEGSHKDRLQTLAADDHR